MTTRHRPGATGQAGGRVTEGQGGVISSESAD